MGSDACLSLVLNYKTQILSMADGPSGRFGVNAPVVVVSRLAQGRVPILRLRLVVWIVKGLIPLLSSVLTIVPVSIHGLDYSLEKNGTRDYITLLHQCYLDNIVSPDNSRKALGVNGGKENISMHNHEHGTNKKLIHFSRIRTQLPILWSSRFLS